MNLSKLSFSHRRRLYRLITTLFYGLTDSLPYFILGSVLTFMLMISDLRATFESLDKAKLSVCSFQNSTIQPQKPLRMMTYPVNQGSAL